MQALQPILNKLTPITLQEMDSVSLLNRIDTKFVAERDSLQELLELLAPDYRILEIGGKRYGNYETLYYDYDDLRLYKNHHNGKKNRYKIRRRTYVDSDLSFLEIKYKNNKGKTLKSRIKSPIQSRFNHEEEHFIQENSPLETEQLNYALTNQFKRITLVSKKNVERLTIDFDINFSKENEIKHLSKILVIEVKTEKGQAKSDALQLMRSRKVGTSSFSKYCTGVTLLYPNIKYNNFKNRLLTLNKLHQNERTLWRRSI